MMIYNKNIMEHLPLLFIPACPVHLVVFNLKVTVWFYLNAFKARHNKEWKETVRNWKCIFTPSWLFWTMCMIYIKNLCRKRRLAYPKTHTGNVSLILWHRPYRFFYPYTLLCLLFNTYRNLAEKRNVFFYSHKTRKWLKIRSFHMK